MTATVTGCVWGAHRALVVDIFGGPGGLAEGLRMLGLDEIGVELDPWACATRRAAGHRVIGSWDNGDTQWVVRTNQNTDRSAGGRYERGVDRPSPTLTTNGRLWAWDQPATTVAGDPRITARCHHDDGSQGANAKTTNQVRAGDYEGTEPIKLTITEALALQSFRPDYPVQGTKTKQFEQVGNAVPPLLAAHVLAAVTGRPLQALDGAA